MSFRLSSSFRGGVSLRLLIALNIFAVTLIGVVVFILAAGPGIQSVLQNPECKAVNFFRSVLGILALDLFVVIGIMIYVLERAIRKPLKELERAALRIGGGDLDVRVAVSGPEEIASLAMTVNAMCESLKGGRASFDRQLSELIKTNEELKAAQKELLHKEALSIVGEMTAGLTHEIGNPLSTIIGYVELMREEELPAEKRAEYLQRVSMELQRIHNTLQGLLEFSRPSKGAVGHVDALETLNETLKLLELDARLKSVSLKADLGEKPLIVRANREGLKQIFINLIINAADATGRKGSLAIKAESEGGKARLIFEDDGKGIPEEDIEKIFEPFYSTKPAGKGTGLGLAVSKRLMESFGGEITAENKKEGEGAIFTLTFISPP